MCCAISCFSFIFFFHGYQLLLFLFLWRCPEEPLLNDVALVLLYSKLFYQNFYWISRARKNNIFLECCFFFFLEGGKKRDTLRSVTKCIRRIWIFHSVFNKICEMPTRSLTKISTLSVSSKNLHFGWCDEEILFPFVSGFSVDFHSELLFLGYRYLYNICKNVYWYCSDLCMHIIFFLSELTKLLKCWLRVFCICIFFHLAQALNISMI